MNDDVMREDFSDSEQRLGVCFTQWRSGKQRGDVMNIEHKAIKAELKQVSEEGEFEAVIATLGVIDHDGDIIESGAFNDGPVSIQPSHDGMALPLGKARIEERGDKAIAVGRLNLDTQSGREWHSHFKFDMENVPTIQEWSFGFQIKERADETRDGEDVRVLKKLDVFEVSPVLLGAGMGTGTVAVKGMKLAAELESVVSRIEEVREMRQAKGKELGAERVEQLKRLHARLDELMKALEDKPGITGPTPEEQIMVEQARRAAAKHIGE